MKSIYDLFSALNSADKSYQLSLAFAFGAVGGFLPFFSLTTVLLFLVVFMLNIPIGIFIVFMTFFVSVGALLDPVFASIGYEILTYPTLNSFFTTLYNNPVALWFGFNHTITMGSVVVSLVLFYPLYILSKFVFEKYRELMQHSFENKKYLKWLNPYRNKDKQQSKPKLIRWWGLGVVSLIYALVAVFFLLFFDSLVRWGASYGLSKATSSDISIGYVNSSFSDARITFGDIKMTSDNQQNSIKSFVLDLNGKNLLRKKLDIEYIGFKDINLVSRQIKKGEKGYKELKPKEDIDFAQKLKNTLPQIEGLFDKENLNSIKETKAIKKRLDDIKTSWQTIKTQKIDKFDENLSQIKENYKAIEDRAKNIKNLEDIQKINENVKELKAKVDLLKKDISNIKQRYKTDKQTINDDFKSIKTLPQKDIDKIIAKYSPNSNGAFNFVASYISSDVAKYRNMGYEYYNKIKPYIPKDANDTKEKVKRAKGRYIRYKMFSNMPTVTMRKFEANIIKEKSNYTSKILNISTDPKRLGAYPSGYIDGISDSFESLKVAITYDKSLKLDTKVAGLFKDSFKLDKNLELNNSKISISSLTTIKDWTKIETNLKTNFINTKFIYKKSESKTDEIIGKILNRIDNFDINGNIFVNIKKPKDTKININSNLDKAISDGFKAQLDEELDIFKSKLKTKIDEKIKEQLGDIDEKYLDGYMKGINSKDDLIAKIEKDIKEKLNPDKLKEELKNKAKKKVDDKIEKQKDKLKNKIKGLI
ncbi:MAG: hypothetical protein B1H07_03565 [Campylobacteraceae bacterium 4484_166]|nr:MAG: hypothetical protein B1H07_03565 [Campylobacteraceae bacterium 4484_166]